MRKPRSPRTRGGAKASMKSIIRNTLFLGISLAMGSVSNAKLWKNAYISFELPEKWNCTLEQTEWVCRSTEPGLAEAIVILTAKEVGPQDSLANYEAHLKRPRTIVTRTGQAVTSTVYQTELRTIANHPWVNSLQFSSEVYNYYTRYLATTKDRIAVLVTFSAHKLHYSKYSQDFFRAIDSLRVVATKATWNATGGNDTTFGQATEGLPNEPGMGGDPSMDPGGGGPRRSVLLDIIRIVMGLLMLGLGGAGVYLLVKRRKKG